jgi:hypothetical protein
MILASITDISQASKKNTLHHENPTSTPISCTADIATSQSSASKNKSKNCCCATVTTVSGSQSL